MINVTAEHDNLSPFKIHDYRLSSQQADNQLVGKSLSQTLDYHCKKCLKYVKIRVYLTAFWLSPNVSAGEPIISPRALAQGLVMVEG